MQPFWVAAELQYFFEQLLQMPTWHLTIPVHPALQLPHWYPELGQHLLS
jgi:hypothetical protein